METTLGRKLRRGDPLNQADLVEFVLELRASTIAVRDRWQALQLQATSRQETEDGDGRVGRNLSEFGFWQSPAEARRADEVVVDEAEVDRWERRFHHWVAWWADCSWLAITAVLRGPVPAAARMLAGAPILMLERKQIEALGLTFPGAAGLDDLLDELWGTWSAYSMHLPDLTLGLEAVALLDTRTDPGTTVVSEHLDGTLRRVMATVASQEAALRLDEAKTAAGVNYLMTEDTPQQRQLWDHVDTRHDALFEHAEAVTTWLARHA